MRASRLDRQTRGEMWNDAVSDFAADNDLTWDEAEAILRDRAEDAAISRAEDARDRY